MDNQQRLAVGEGFEGGAPARPRPGVRTLLLALVLACLVPGAIGVGLLVQRQIRNDIEQTENSTVLTARALTLALDGELRSARNFAAGLASSDHLARGDLATFHARSRLLLKATGVGSRMALTDASGRHVLNTLRDFGEALPPLGNAAQLQRVFSTGQPSMSNSFTAGLTHQPAVSFDAPVTRDGQVLYVVSLLLDQANFGKLLQRQQLPAGWVSSITDPSGTTVARSALADRYVGQKANPDLLRRLETQQSGAYSADTREGIPAVIAFSRSAETGWTVAIAVPRQALTAPWLSDMAWLAAGLLGLFGLGGYFAWRQGTRIASSVQGLKDAAVAMAQGQPSPPGEMHFAEAQDAGRAIRQSLQLLADRAADAAAAQREAEAGQATLDAAL